jgi:hypothetical protein
VEVRLLVESEIQVLVGPVQALGAARVVESHRRPVLWFGHGG